MQFTEEMLAALEQSLREGYYDGLTHEDMRALVVYVRGLENTLYYYQLGDRGIE